MTKVKDLLTDKEKANASKIVWINCLNKNYKDITIKDASDLGWIFVDVDEFGNVKQSQCLHLLAIETLTKRAIEQNKPIF